MKKRTGIASSTALAFLACFCAVPASEARKAPAAQPALATMQVRIEVDSTGAVTAVEPTSGMPGPIVEAARRHAQGLNFEAPQLAGRPVPGTTFARMNVCAIRNGAGGLDVALGAFDNGPGVDPRMLRPSFFAPVSAELVRLGRLEMEAIYEVRPDGRAGLVSVTTVPANFSGRRGLEAGFRKWLAPMRFQPEKIDGRAVATRMRMPITFTMEPTSGLTSARDVQRKHIEAHPTCQALLGEQTPDHRPVAVDSPFRLQPAS